MDREPVHNASKTSLQPNRVWPVAPTRRARWLVGAAMALGITSCGGASKAPASVFAWSGGGDVRAPSLRLVAAAPSVDERWIETQVVTIEGAATGLMGSGGRAGFQLERRLTAATRVLALDPRGLPTEVQIEVSEAREKLQLGSKQSRSIEAADGHTYVAERDGEWSYRRLDGKPVSDPEEDVLAALGLGWRVQLRGMLPDRELWPGEELKLARQQLSALGVSDAFQDVRVKFLGHEQGDVARFAFSGRLQAERNDLRLAGALTGELDLRPADGWPLRVEAEGKAELNELDSDDPATGSARITFEWQLAPSEESS